MKSWRVEAPSNIALIKYMGKVDASQNRPSNASFSYTLDHLTSRVDVTESDNEYWQPLLQDGIEEFHLSESGQQRFLKHWARLKEELQIPGRFIIRSGNRFPSDCGIASSASSFAALTLAAVEVAKDLSLQKDKVEALSANDISHLARLGSGSSCRSLFRPWALWRSEAAEEIKTPFEQLHHQVIVTDSHKKQVSSSEAHKRVVTSLLFEGRVVRAEKRLAELLDAMNVQDWARMFEIVWAEFWDMHALFETSNPSFGYMSAGSLRVLQWARQMWSQEKDGPLVTMDAGSNVHLLYRMDQKRMAVQAARELGEWGRVISSLGLEGTDHG